MADKNGLRLIGWVLGAVTASVILIAAVLVLDAVAGPTAPGDHAAPQPLAVDIR